MNAVELAVLGALQSLGEQQKANKAYLEFMKANLIVPIEKTDEEAPQVLFLYEDGRPYLPVFSSDDYLNDWVQTVKDNIAVLRLSGVDLLKGVGQGVSLLFNIGSPLYKVFHPEEIERMRSMVLKIFK